MLQNRRQFIRRTAITASSLVASSWLTSGAKNKENEEQLITILHTNDVHSHLNPFPMDGSDYQGLGGVAARAGLINEIRSKTEQVLLLDAGDIFQGTPYFNLYKGEPEIKAMSLLHYDAVTMGNHDFDGGIDNFTNMIVQHANFPVVICNYDFKNTSFENKNLPYKVFKKGNLKIGVTGAGIELQGLVADNLYGGVKYLDPIENVNKTADILKKKEGCDFIICLSHLGDRYSDNKVSDDVLARETEDVDLIIGGHTHRFFLEPRKYVNRRGKEVVVNQVGWAGIQLGRLDYNFIKNGKKLLQTKSVIIGKKYED